MRSSLVGPIRWALIALIYLSALGCADKTEPPVRVGIHLWPGYDTLIVARDQGYLDNSGVQLIETPSATESIRAFQNESIDGAFLTLDEVLRLAERGHDPIIILITDFSHGADGLIAQPNIKSLENLKGKTVGVESNALGAYVLARALSKAGLKSSDVTPVPMHIIETEKAFLDKRVDAVVTYEPHLTRIKNAGGNLLFDSTEIPDEITDVLVVRKRVIQQSPKALQRLVNSHFNVRSQLLDGTESVVSMIAEREKVSVQELNDLLAGLSLPSQQDNQAILSSSDTRVTRTVSKLAAVMKEQNLLMPAFTEQDYRDDRFVQGNAN